MSLTSEIKWHLPVCWNIAHPYQFQDLKASFAFPRGHLPSVYMNGPLVSFYKHEMHGQEMPSKASHAAGGESVGSRSDPARHFPKEVEFFLTLHKGWRITVNLSHYFIFIFVGDPQRSQSYKIINNISPLSWIKCYFYKKKSIHIV